MQTVFLAIRYSMLHRISNWIRYKQWIRQHNQMAVKPLTLQNYNFKLMIWHCMGKSIN